MLHQVDDALLHAMSGTELSRVRTELRLLPPEAINQTLLESRAADIVMQSSAVMLGRKPPDGAGSTQACRRCHRESHRMDLCEGSLTPDCGWRRRES
jgi:hypothetical protein